MGSEQSQQAEIAGQANTNVIVEQELDKVDMFHSIVLMVLLVFVVAQTAYLGYRHQQKKLKKKYLERMVTVRSKV